jgi:hypothetical protein
MTQKVKSGLAIAMVALTLISNCTTIGHDASMRDELKVSVDKHKSMQRPLEVTHDIQDKNITGYAEGYIFWLPGIFDLSLGVFDTIGQVLGKVLKTVGDSASSIPYVGPSIEKSLGDAGANAGNIGPLLNNFKVLVLANEAEGKAVYENNIDGFFRTGVEAEISINVPWIIFKDYKVTVTGKPVVAKSLGMISDARLAKIQVMAAKAGCTTCADLDKAPAAAGK